MILIIPKMAKSTTLPYKIPIREKTGLGAETGERGIIFFYYLLDYKKPVPLAPTTLATTRFPSTPSQTLATTHFQPVGFSKKSCTHLYPQFTFVNNRA
jgi:hypothetical protein